MKATYLCLLYLAFLQLSTQLIIFYLSIIMLTLDLLLLFSTGFCHIQPISNSLCTGLYFWFHILKQEFLLVQFLTNILFAMCSKPLSFMFDSHSVKRLSFADDLELHMSYFLCSTLVTWHCFKYTLHIKGRMSTNFIEFHKEIDSAHVTKREERPLVTFLI